MGQVCGGSKVGTCTCGRVARTSLTPGMSNSSPKTKIPGCSSAWLMRLAHAAPFADLASRQNCCRAAPSSAVADMRLPAHANQRGVSGALVTYLGEGRGGVGSTCGARGWVGEPRATATRDKSVHCLPPHLPRVCCTRRMVLVQQQSLAVHGTPSVLQDRARAPLLHRLKGLTPLPLAPAPAHRCTHTRAPPARRPALLRPPQCLPRWPPREEQAICEIMQISRKQEGDTIIRRCVPPTSILLEHKSQMVITRAYIFCCSFLAALRSSLRSLLSSRRSLFDRLGL